MELKFEHVTKIISGETILDDIDFTMKQGRVYGLQGKNGSGKTMIMRAACGLIRPSSGRVLAGDQVLGKDMDFLPSVGALIENPGFVPQFTGYQNLKMLADIQKRVGKEEIMESLERADLSAAADKKYRKYSLGMKQKLGIAAAIMEHPEVIILDEPTNALDEESVKRLYDILREEKKRKALIIIASHDKEELEMLSDEIYEIESGKIKTHRITKKEGKHEEE